MRTDWSVSVVMCCCWSVCDDAGCGCVGAAGVQLVSNEYVSGEGGREIVVTCIVCMGMCCFVCDWCCKLVVVVYSHWFWGRMRYGCVCGPVVVLYAVRF